MERDKKKFSFEVSAGAINEEEIKIDYIGSQGFPKIPMKPVVGAVLLMVCGIVLTILGFVEEFTNFQEPSRGIAFWVLGSITLTPGLYFSFQFYRAYRAKTPAERMNVLSNIPDID